MKTVAYLRVSTGSQDLATQKLVILDFTQKRRFPVDEFIASQASSRKSPIERRSEEMLGTLQSGDRLLVSELSRLGRSLGQVLQIVATLIERKIRFIAIKEAIEVEGKQDLRTKVMIALFGLFAEVERDLILRTDQGRTCSRESQREAARPAQGCLGKIQAGRQGGRYPDAIGQGSLEGLHCQDPGRLPFRPLPLHRDSQDRARLTSKNRLGQPGPYVVFLQQSGRYPKHVGSHAGNRDSPGKVIRSGRGLPSSRMYTPSLCGVRPIAR